jgi:uncharacterized protein YbgA (DUF1722 family)/uncharacterized protein YbbK (DUF523 family)
MTGATAGRVAQDPVRVGISSCLLGDAVRFDGGHKRHPVLVGTLGRFVTWVPVCPEVELGLGTPRESIRLEKHEDGVRFVQRRSARDLTEEMRAYAARRAEALLSEDLCGFVLKKDSPSCGLDRVRVYGPGGMPAKSGRGLFAAALVERFPGLPVEEEGRLADAALRDNFVERVFTYRRLRSFFSGRWTVGGLVDFHTAHKLTVMAHSTEAYRRLGRLVASARTLTRAALERRYEEGLMAALALPASPGRHANVLHHVLGHVSDALSPEERQEVLGLIDDHRRRLVPLVAPMTLLRHHARRHRVGYLRAQTYLDHHPRELMTGTHV